MQGVRAEKTYYSPGIETKSCQFFAQSSQVTRITLSVTDKAASYKQHNKDHSGS